MGESHLPPGSADALRSRLRERGLAICISGVDGTGKTTLARQLVAGLDAAGMPSRHLHLHQWYINVFATPLLLLHNRHFGHKVLVFDRSIFDNIAVAAASPRFPRWLPKCALEVVRVLYPRFDHSFYLTADFGELVLRRPETREQRHAELTRMYDWIASKVAYDRQASNAGLFDRVLDAIAAP